MIAIIQLGATAMATGNHNNNWQRQTRKMFPGSLLTKWINSKWNIQYFVFAHYSNHQVYTRNCLQLSLPVLIDVQYLDYISPQRDYHHFINHPFTHLFCNANDKSNCLRLSKTLLQCFHLALLHIQSGLQQWAAARIRIWSDKIIILPFYQYWEKASMWLDCSGLRAQWNTF